MENADSNEAFMKIMEQPEYQLPIRWDGNDFCQTVYFLLKKYKKDILREFPDQYADVEKVSNGLYQAVVNSFRGLPQIAFGYLEKVMAVLGIRRTMRQSF